MRLNLRGAADIATLLRATRSSAASYLVCELCSTAGMIAMGGGFASGFLGFGLAAVASPEAAAVADVSFAVAGLSFGFALPLSPEEGAPAEAAPSFSAVALRLGFAAGAAEVAAAASLSLAAAGLITTIFFFSGLDSFGVWDPGAGGLVPV